MPEGWADVLRAANQVRHAVLRASEPELPDVLKDEGEAHGGDQRGELGRVA